MTLVKESDGQMPIPIKVNGTHSPRQTLLKFKLSATWKHVAESAFHVAESPSATWV
ncbi:hypothetical protein SLEP1_g26872 [Rubroshorea leprosula]|uniref:Uncharacterized protein n=1 Tax=Rubroshorea leprosula TaxID=152421 RepID=A0AAV5JU15_9ROSI|nr:hypothetical protein SLEP1_g26872 [Rubroshorea leprosula]